MISELKLGTVWNTHGETRLENDLQMVGVPHLRWLIMTWGGLTHFITLNSDGRN